MRSPLETTAVGKLQPIVSALRFARSNVSASRGRRCPPGAQAGAACAGAPASLRCSSQGRAAELAAFAALTALGQPPRVSSRSALRAPALGLRSSAHQIAPLAGTACRSIAVHGSSSKDTVSLLDQRDTVIELEAVPAEGAVRGAEHRSFQGGARSALRALTCRSMFERSERSERSEFCGTPWKRAAQGSRSAAEAAPFQRPLRARLPATRDSSCKREAMTLLNVRLLPQPAIGGHRTKD
jgi:hypothetical protein